MCLLRFPNIACELLTSDVSIINDKLGGDESLLEVLYHFLEQDPPLNPLLASFFSKTIGNLIARKTEQVTLVYLPFFFFFKTVQRVNNTMCVRFQPEMMRLLFIGNCFSKEKGRFHWSGAETY